jgi:hypothetical protein
MKINKYDIEKDDIKLGFVVVFAILLYVLVELVFI